MKTKLILGAIILLLIAALVSLITREPTIKTEIETRYDTVVIHYPVAHDTIVTERIVRVPIPCGITEDDSVIIQLAEQVHYVDSNYEAWVSGIDPQLDSIRVFNKVDIIRVTKEIPTYKPFYVKEEKTLQFGGFVSANSGFDLNHINAQTGIKLAIKKFSVKAGYNVGEAKYPFLGVEYDLR